MDEYFSVALIATSCDLNTYVNPSSQILTIDKSELCVRLGKMWHSNASSGKAGKSSKYGLIDCMVWPFGNPTKMGGPMFVDG